MSTNIEIISSIHAFLAKCGYKESCKVVLKEAKLTEKALKTVTAKDLEVLFKDTAKKVVGGEDTSMDESADESSSDDDDDDSDDSSDDEAPKKTAAAAPVAAKPAAATKAAAKDESSSDDDSDDSDDSDEESEAPKKAAPATAAAPAPAKAVAVKKEAESESDDSSSSDDDSDDSDDDEEEEKAAPVAQKRTIATEDDDADAPPAAKKAKTTPAVTPSAAASASATMGLHKIYVKGLPWSASEAEVKDFFKASGSIKSVELPVGEDGRSSGTAYVVFAERAELEKALELDGQYWPGTERWLKIQEGFEKPARASFGGGVRPEGCDTVFCGNLPFDVEEDQLREVFAQAGTVDRIRFAMAEDGSFKGFAHVQFSDGASTDEAVKLAGTDINGRAMRVDYAPPRNRDGAAGGAGGGAGGAGGRGGRGAGGRGGGGRGGPGGRGGGRGRGGPPTAGSKNKGSIVAGAAGKKVTFD